MAKTNLLAMALERPKRERTPVRDDLVRSLMEQQAHAGVGTPVYSIGQGLARSGNMMLLSLMDKWEKDEKSDERKKLADKLFGTAGTSSESGGKLAKVLKGEKIAPADGSFVERVVNVESGGDPNARNPRSSATGPGQFIDSTWREFIADQHPQLLASGQDIGALRSDPDLARQAVDWYGNQNAQFLEGRGLPVNEATKYLAHFAGPGGAESVLSAPPDTPVRDILGRQVVQANPFLADMTAADLAGWAGRKMGSDTSTPGVSIEPAGIRIGLPEQSPVPAESRERLTPALPQQRLVGQEVPQSQPQQINMRQALEPHVGGAGGSYIDMQRQFQQTGQLPGLSGMPQGQPQAAPPAPDAGRIAPDMPQQPFAAPEAPQGATDPVQEQMGLLSAIPMEEQVVLRQMVESGEIQPFQVLQYARELRAEQQPEYAYETMPDGTLLQIDKRSGQVSPVYEGGQKPTGTMQEYETARQQGYEGSFFDYQRDLKTAGAARNMGTPPAGYRVQYDEQGNPVEMVPIPGSPADIEAKAAEQQAAMRTDSARIGADVVVDSVDTAIRQIDESPLATTGLGGQMTSGVGGLPAHDLKNTLDTIKSNVGFDKLQRMREASPTGGALGQVSNIELGLLNATLGALEQSQSPEQLKTNLQRVREVYLDIIHGPGNRPQESQPQVGEQGGQPEQDITPGTTAINPQTGERIRWNGTEWERVQ